MLKGPWGAQMPTQPSSPTAARMGATRSATAAGNQSGMPGS